MMGKRDLNLTLVAQYDKINLYKDGQKTVLFILCVR